MINRIFILKHITPEQQNILQEHITGSRVSEIKLGEKIKRECAIMFCDLCNFTNMSLGLSDDFILSLLQSFFENTSKIITNHKGMIDRFPGDGVVGFFPRYILDKNINVVDLSLKAASRIMNWFYYRFKKEHEGQVNRNSFKLNLKIGIDAGRINIAHVGSPIHSELILFGDEVNFASKCQEIGDSQEIIVGNRAKDKTTISARYFSKGPSTKISIGMKEYLSFKFNWADYHIKSILNKITILR